MCACFHNINNHYSQALEVSAERISDICKEISETATGLYISIVTFATEDKKNRALDDVFSKDETHLFDPIKTKIMNIYEENIKDSQPPV